MQKNEGFFKKLLGLFFASSSPEAAKKRDLKKIAKEINRQKFKWYKPSSGEALPQMGRFFHDIYATIGAAQGMLSNANSSAALKLIVVEESLSDAQREIKERIAEEQLKKRAEKENISSLEIQVKKELDKFQREFTTEKIKSIDHIYSQIEEFSNFVTFDYYVLLKKFDPNFQENNFSSPPNGGPIRGEYILDDLKDFTAVVYGLPLNADWKVIFAMIKRYKGAEPATLSRWTKVAHSLADIRKSNILTLIIRHIEQNPIAQVKPVVANTRVVDSYISRLRSQTEGFLKKIVQEAKTSKVAQLAQQLFGTEPPDGLENYTHDASEKFKAKGFTGFTRTTELNSLASFLDAYLKTDIAEIINLCLVRGKWTLQEESASFSNSYHALVDLSAKIKAFDDSLSEDAPFGTKLKSLLMRQEHDREARDQLKTNLKDVNRNALSFVATGAQHLVVIGKNIKMLIDDYEKQPHRAITNWREIESVAEKSISVLLSNGYKKVCAIVMLLQTYLKGSKSDNAE